MKGTDATNPLSSWGRLYAFPACYLGPDNLSLLGSVSSNLYLDSNLVELVYPITFLFS